MKFQFQTFNRQMATSAPLNPKVQDPIFHYPLDFSDVSNSGKLFLVFWYYYILKTTQVYQIIAENVIERKTKLRKEREVTESQVAGGGGFFARI